MMELLSIREIHESLPPQFYSSAFAKCLESDIKAFTANFPPCVAARSTSDLERLRLVVPEGFVLQPYQEIVSWDEDVHYTIQRASHVIILTEAKQLLPQPVASLLEWAHAERVPVVFLVEGLGRMRDPDVYLAQAEGPVRDILRTCSHRLFGIGDSRYSGPSLEDACRMSADLSDRSAALRLASVRRDQLARWIDSKLAQCIAVTKARSQEVSLARESRNGMVVLATSTVMAWVEMISEYQDCIRTLHLEQIIDRVLVEERGLKAVSRFLALLTEQLRKSSRASGKVVHQCLEENARLFLAGLRADRARLEVVHSQSFPSEDLSEAVTNIDPDLLYVELERVVGDLENQLCETVSSDTLLVQIVEFLSHHSLSNDAKMSVKPPKGQRLGEAGGSDTQKGNKFVMGDELAIVLRSLPNQALRSRMLSAGNKVIEDLSMA